MSNKDKLDQQKHERTAKFVAKPVVKDKQEPKRASQPVSKTDEPKIISENTDVQQPISQPMPEPNAAAKYKFRIEVMEKDYDHPASETQDFSWRKVSYSEPVYIEAADKNELAEIQQRYHACDQHFKIVECVYRPDQQYAANAQQVQPQQCQQQFFSQQRQQQIQVKQKPKIVTIGDIQLKYDGNDVYQKQWIRVTPDEANNFRVISDSNNKIVPMKGRHFEVRRWVKIQETDQENED